MTRWRPQSFRKNGLSRGIDKEVIANAIEIGTAITNANALVQPVFTLRHLAHLADVDYAVLRAIVSRSIRDSYRTFRIRKRPSHSGEQRFRTISVPSPHLMQAQRWISQNILQHVQVHPASVAYSKDSNIVDAASLHCNCRWLIKLDIKSFFESISEIAVYHEFRAMKFQPLISFEMARLCTRLSDEDDERRDHRWWADKVTYQVISAYTGYRMGYLPQGAPTSPMLANLAVRDLDAAVQKIAKAYGLTYTRYADDIALSTDSTSFSREKARQVIGKVYRAMGSRGFSPNATKTRISSPGARKVVLGLLVDGDVPRLSRDFKARLRQHLYYLENLGPTVHARKRKFASTQGLKNYLVGLISYARQVEPEYADECCAKFDNVTWPL